MPIFTSSCSPFDTDVEKATDEKNTTDDWGLILDICEKTARHPNGARDCLRSIVKRLNHRVPFVAMQTLTLLDACVKNCGHQFHLELCGRDFMAQCRSLLSHKTQPKVAHKLRYLIKKWSEMPEFKDNPALYSMRAMYEELKRDGAEFTDPDASPRKATSAARQAAKEDEDIAKAIALSIEDAEKTHAKKVDPIYPSYTVPSVSHTLKSKAQEAGKHVHFEDGTTLNPRRVLYSVRALYDFEAAEDNELTFHTGELISVTDDSDVNWWKGFNQRGDGLFPSNFVTADLSVDLDTSHEDTYQSTRRKEVYSSVDPAPCKPEIKENKIDEALTWIQNTDPTGQSHPDPAEMLQLEEQCRAMGPLIDAELEKVDREYNQLVELNQRVLEALQMYHSLMKEGPGPMYTATPFFAPPGFLPLSGLPTASLQMPTTASSQMPTIPPQMPAASPQMPTSSPQMVTALPQMSTASPQMSTVSPQMSTVSPQMSTVSPQMAATSPQMATDSLQMATTVYPQMGIESPQIDQVVSGAETRAFAGGLCADVKEGACTITPQTSVQTRSQTSLPLNIPPDATEGTTSTTTTDTPTTNISNNCYYTTATIAGDSGGVAA